MCALRPRDAEEASVPLHDGLEPHAARRAKRARPEVRGEGLGDGRDLLSTDEGWLYLAAILDLFSRRVVGCSTSATIDRALALDALQRMYVRRGRRTGSRAQKRRWMP